MTLKTPPPLYFFLINTCESNKPSALASSFIPGFRRGEVVCSVQDTGEAGAVGQWGCGVLVLGPGQGVLKIPSSQSPR